MDALIVIGKLTFSALLIYLLSEIAKRSASMAAVLASLPITSILAATLLYWETSDVERVASFISNVLWMIYPSLIFFIVFPIFLRRGLNFSASLALSILVTAAVYSIFIVVLRWMDIEITKNAHNLIVQTHGHQTYALIDGKTYSCSIGKNGVTQDKKEGDNKTPVGRFPLRHLFYRPDKIPVETIRTGLPTQALTAHDGWCDEPKAREYNQFVDLQVFDKKISHEELWRSDNLYDVILVVGYNDSPIVPGKGSAIFIHIAREDYSGTAGCIAFSKSDLLEILPKLGRDSYLIVEPPRRD
jgi:L,D-peptidoglycan transpeptidase YkuD (ErfK/YbiS/YcfS/YnhG family)